MQLSGWRVPLNFSFRRMEEMIKFWIQEFLEISLHHTLLKLKAEPIYYLDDLVRVGFIDDTNADMLEYPKCLKQTFS